MPKVKKALCVGPFIAGVLALLWLGDWRYLAAGLLLSVFFIAIFAEKDGTIR